VSVPTAAAARIISLNIVFISFVGLLMSRSLGLKPDAQSKRTAFRRTPDACETLKVLLNLSRCEPVWNDHINIQSCPVRPFCDRLRPIMRRREMVSSRKVHAMRAIVLHNNPAVSGKFPCTVDSRRHTSDLRDEGGNTR
jgi:hypothetical protein